MTVTSPTTTSLKRSPIVGERRELGRYSTPTDGQRLIVGQRVDGHVRLVDVPASGQGRAYLIERELEKDGYAALQSLVGDYLAQAAKLQAIPLASSPLDRYLEHLDRS
jgi:hypothetical protein